MEDQVQKDIQLEELFKQSRAHYMELLSKAKPFPPEVLTVPRMNKMHAQNLAALKFLNELKGRMQSDASKPEVSNDAYIYLYSYASEIELFLSSM